MRIKYLLNLIFDYRTYIMLGLFSLVLAPFAEIAHQDAHSITFAKWAFLLFCIALLKGLLDTFLSAHPKLRKKLHV